MSSKLLIGRHMSPVGVVVRDVLGEHDLHPEAEGDQVVLEDPLPPLAARYLLPKRSVNSAKSQDLSFSSVSLLPLNRGMINCSRSIISSNRVSFS